MTKKGLSFIPLNREAKNVELATNFSYILKENDILRQKNEHLRGKHDGKSRRFGIFKDNIIRLLYSQFEYHGMTREERAMVEYCFLNEGSCVAVKENGIVSFGNVEIESVLYSFYGTPLQVACRGATDKKIINVKEPNFVIGYDTLAILNTTLLVAPIITYVDNLAKELDNSYSALRVAVESNKASLIFSAKNKKEGAILRQVMDGISENSPHIVIENDDNFQPENILIKSSSTNIIEQFHSNFVNTWSSVLDLIGFENSPQNKKERLVVAEAIANMNISNHIANDRLKAREIWLKEINEKFGTNYSVTFSVKHEKDLNEKEVETEVETEVEEEVEKDDI